MAVEAVGSKFSRNNNIIVTLMCLAFGAWFAYDGWISEEYKEFKTVSQFYEVLIKISKLRCERKCRDGGGTDACQIRDCCKDKNIQGCWKCQKFENCYKLHLIRPVNKDANLKNLRKIREEGIDSFLKGVKYW